MPLALACLTVQEHSNGVFGYVRMLERVTVKEHSASIRAQQEPPHRKGRTWGSFNARFERVQQGRARHHAEAQGYLAVFKGIDCQANQRRHSGGTPLVASHATRPRALVRFRRQLARVFGDAVDADGSLRILSRQS